MDVDRHPRVVVDRVGDRDERPTVGDPVGRHHEGEPGIGDQHDAGADDIEANPQAQVHERMELPPAVVVAVEEAGLQEEEQDVGKERRREHAHQVVGELRVQRDEHEGEERAEGRGHRERDREELGELVGEPVVARITGLVADRLDQHREDRDGEDERREQQVELRHRPDGHAAADDGKGSILGLDVRPGPGGCLGGGSFGLQSRRPRRRVGHRGRGPVRLPVLAVGQEGRDQHDGAEHHQAGHGTEHEQQFAVGDTVHAAASINGSPPAGPPELPRRRA